MKTKVLIIEDEIESSKSLKKLLAEFGDIETIGVLKSVEQSIIWFNENDQPDLIFMDVQLNDGDSFDIFEKINLECPIIFTTAYSEYAIKAIKQSSLDYILKPLTKLSISEALIRYYSNELKNTQLLNYRNFGKQCKDRILVKEGNQFIPIKILEIAYVYWSDYAFLKKFDGKSFLINYSVNQVEELLPQDLFVRINRQVLTNINAIESLYKDGNSYYINLLPKYNNKAIKISKDTYSNLRRTFV